MACLVSCLFLSRHHTGIRRHIEARGVSCNKEVKAQVLMLMLPLAKFDVTLSHHTIPIC